MKKLITLLLFFAVVYLSYSQVPAAFNYQAVVRDATGNIVANRMISLKISILKDSEYGSTVYAEIHKKETNNVGLINLIIGEGQTVYGVFSPNGWDIDKHLIKIEIDVNGGSSYVNMGTTQLLSVPYAFHAQTAETFSETDPVYEGSQAANITATDITNLGNLSGVNTGDQDGSETKVNAGTNITITGSGTFSSPYVVNVTEASSLAVGDSYQGGIIFWLDATGEHGLIAATADQSTGIQWYNGTYIETNAVRDGIGAGMFNTERIIANQGTGSYAAQICANYQNGGYGDWYLPSKYELNLLYLQKAVVGGFANSGYWSSTESVNYSAWLQSLTNGTQVDYDKKYPNYYVRAIRAF